MDALLIRIVLLRVGPNWIVNVYYLTPAVRTQPVFRTLNLVSRVSVMEEFHCISERTDFKFRLMQCIL